MTSPIDGSRMLPTLAARASFSPATVTSPAAVKQGDREQRRAQRLSFGRRISADFGVAPEHRPRPTIPSHPPVSGGASRPSATASTRSRTQGSTETTPLLSEGGASYAAVAAGDGDDQACRDDALLTRRASTVSVNRGRFHGLPGMNRPATVWNEFRVLVASSVPLSAGLMLENALNTINILVCGRLGAAELAVAGNSSLLVMVTGYPLPLALAAAFTTLSAPLYAQVEARHHIGHWLQRTILLSLMLSVPVMLFWWNISPLLLALKQPPELVEGMKWYLRAAVLVLPALGLLESVKSYLQVQGIMTPPPLILLTLLPLHASIAIYLVHYTSIGAPGAALATATTLWIAGIILVILALKTRARECWDGVSNKAFQEWTSVLWLAVPGALMFGSELWAFEIIALLAGRLGRIAVAAQAVISTLDNLVAMVPYAISIGIANRVGNLLGHGSRGIPRARQSVRAGLLLEVLVAGSTGLSLLIFRNQIARIFTDDPDVAREAAEAAVFVASYQVFDGLQNVGAACLRAFGRQNIGSIIHFVGYYLVGLPFGAWLALGRPRWGLAGLWAGAALALACTSAAEILFAATIKWEAEVERVQLREEDMSESSEDDDDEDGVA